MADKTLRFVISVDASQVASASRQAAQALAAVEKAAAKAGTESGKGSDKAAQAAEKQAAASAKAGEAATESGQAGAQAGEATAAGAEQATAALEAQRAAAERVGNQLMLFGAAAIGASALLVKTAMDWETAFAGVQKTVDGTSSEMAVLEGELRNIAKTTPATHKEIAAVAEAAGQLGVKRQDVAAFTKVMIDLGETTNLTAEEAAISMRQFMNIMGSSASAVDNIGSALVALGNNSATTEKDILAMAQRLAGAGRQAKMSEADVLGIAAALSSVGIEAEAGGTAMSQTIKMIDAMVREGGSKLETLAKVSGMTSSQFAKAWRTDAASALNAVVVGLGEMSARGENVNGVLSDLGFEGIRQTDALLRLAGATKAAGAEYDLLGRSLSLSAEEFVRNAALQEEAEKRYGTTASKAKIALNEIVDAAISMGNAMLPAVRDGIEAVSQLAQGFASLPSSITGPIGSITALVGVMALGAGGALKLVTSFGAARDAITAMGASMRTVSIAGGAVGLALAGVAAVVASWAGEKARVQAAEDSFAAALQGTNGALRDQSGAFNDNLRAVAAKQAQDEGLLDIAQKYGIAYSEVTDAMLGNEEAARRVTEAVRQANAAQAEGAIDTSHAFDEYNKMKSGIETATTAVDSAIRKHRQLAEATGESADAAAQDAAATEEAAAAKERLAAAANEAVSAIKSYYDAIWAAESAAIAYEAAIDKAAESVEKNGRTLDITTEAGRANKQALLEVGEAGQRLAKEMLASGAGIEEVVGQVAATREQFISTAEAMGATSEEAAELADRLGLIPEDTVARMVLEGAKDGTLDLEALQEQINKLPPEIRSQLALLGLDEAENKIEQLDADLNGIPDLIQADVAVEGASEAASEIEDVGRAVDGLPKSTGVELRSPGVEEVKAAIQKVIDGLFKIPKRKEVDIKAPGLPDTGADIEKLHNALMDLPRQRDIQVTAPTIPETEEALRGLGGVIASIPEVTTTAVQLIGHGQALGGIASVTSALQGVPRVTAPRITTVGHGTAVSNANSVTNALGRIPKSTVPHISTSGHGAAIGNANAVTSAIGVIPKNPRITISASAPALGVISAVASALSAINGRVATATIRTVHQTVNTLLAGGGLVGDHAPRRFASGGAAFPYGGRVAGPGTSTSDSIPARLSRDEFVVKAAAVRHYGVSALYALNEMKLPKRGLALARGGGAVAPSRTPGGTQTVNVTLQMPATAAASGSNAADWLNDFASRARRMSWNVRR